MKFQLKDNSLWIIGSNEKKLPLMETTKDDILRRRLQYTKKILQSKNGSSTQIILPPLFILKENNSLFFTEIDNCYKLNGSALLHNTSHLCSRCKYCRPRDCLKVFDGSYYFTCSTALTTEYAIADASRIEKYDFIRSGYESYGTSNDCLFVTKCDYFR